MRIKEAFSANPFDRWLESTKIKEIFVERDSFKEILKFYKKGFTTTWGNSKFNINPTNILIVGRKGIGKTFLMEYMKRKFERYITPIYIDKLARTESKFINQIIKSILDNWHRFEFTNDDVAKSFWKTLNRVKRNKILHNFNNALNMLGNSVEKTVVFFIDEANAIENEDLQGILNQTLFTRVGFVFGIKSEIWKKIFKEAIRDRFDFIIFLPPFNEWEVKQLIKKRVNRVKTKELESDIYPLTEDAFKFLIEITNGIPRDIRNILHTTLTINLNKEYITSKDLEKIAIDVIPELESPLKAVTGDSTELEKKIINYVHDHPWSSISEIARGLGKPQPMISYYINKRIDSSIFSIRIEGRTKRLNISDNVKSYLS